jgi:hypothetical protein
MAFESGMTPIVDVCQRGGGEQREKRAILTVQPFGHAVERFPLIGR